MKANKTTSHKHKHKPTTEQTMKNNKKQQTQKHKTTTKQIIN